MAYIVGAVVATQGGSSGSIDTTQPDLQTTNLQAPPVATIVAISSGTETGTTVRFFEPINMSIFNSGDDVAPAGYTVNLYLSRTKEITDSSLRFRDITVNATTRVGEFTRVSSGNSQNIRSIRFDGATANITSGSYFMIARVGGTEELDASNNDALAVGQVQVYDPRSNPNNPLPVEIPSEPNPGLGQTGRTNFVLERLTAPSFAFARDAVNAGQQTVDGERVFNVSAQVAVRGLPLAREEQLELQVFLSTDQSLSDDDIALVAPVQPGDTMPRPVLVNFPASAVGTVRQFQNLTLRMPRIEDFEVALPQTFFLVGRVLPRGQPGAGGTVQSNLDIYDDVRPATIRTRVYGRFVADRKAILPDLTVDGVGRTDPDALEFTTTAFSIPTPGSQRVFSFEIPDADNIDPDESQVLVLLQSNDFDPVLDLVSPLGSSLRVVDDSANGLSSVISAPLSSAGTGNNTFYVAISSRSGTGSGNFNLTIFLQSRSDPSKPVIQPINLGNVLSLGRGRATLVGTDTFPVNLPENSSFLIRTESTPANGVTVQFQSGGAIQDLTEAAAAEVVTVINNQAGEFVTANVDGEGKIFIASNAVGNASNIQVEEGAIAAAGVLGFPIGETDLSEGEVTFNFQQAQDDSEFIFFLPGRGEFTITTAPSLDIFGGVNASLAFFDGVSQQNIPLVKSSQGADRTRFTAANGEPLVLDRGFYALIFNAPQPIVGVDFRLSFDLSFDRTVQPQ